MTLGDLLRDPDLEGFRVDGPPECAAREVAWVLEAARPEELEEAEAGDLVVLGSRLPGSEEARDLPPCEARGIAALVLPEEREGRSRGLATAGGTAILRYPRYLAPAQAARLLGRAIASRQTVGPRPADGMHRAARPLPGSAGSRRRVLAVAAGSSVPALRPLSAVDIAASLGTSLPHGVEARALEAEETALVLRIAAEVPPTDLRAALRVFAAERRLSLGLSEALSLEGSLEEAFTRAREARELGTALLGPGQVSYYENLYLYKAFIDDGQPELLLSFSRRTLDHIRVWDETHGSELLRTLETYFELGRNLRRTAERMGIHRRTLRSRLEKIEEITACPFEGEGRMSYELVLAYKHLSKVKL